MHDAKFFYECLKRQRITSGYQSSAWSYINCILLTFCVDSWSILYFHDNSRHPSSKLNNSWLVPASVFPSLKEIACFNFEFSLYLWCFHFYYFPFLRTRSDFEKHFTIKNCDKTFLKIISRLKKWLKSDDVSTLAVFFQNYQKAVMEEELRSKLTQLKHLREEVQNAFKDVREECTFLRFVTIVRTLSKCSSLRNLSPI